MKIFTLHHQSNGKRFNYSNFLGKSLISNYDITFFINANTFLITNKSTLFYICVKLWVDQIIELTMKRRTFFTILLCTQNCFAIFNHPNCYFIKQIESEYEACFSRSSQVNSQDYNAQASYPTYNGNWVGFKNVTFPLLDCHNYN